MRLRFLKNWGGLSLSAMKLQTALLVASAMLVAACSPKRLSPVVLQEPSPAKTAPARPLTPRPIVAAPAAKHSTPSTRGTVAHSSKAPVRSTASVSASRAKADEAARLAEKKRKLAVARRLQARKLAAASYEAGRQLLRENQTESALRAFRESVRLNSSSPDAWMGVAYVCEIKGNTKDAVEAFRAAKRLWGM
jgi:Flp pilus assembly protein TadD